MWKKIAKLWGRIVGFPIWLCNWVLRGRKTRVQASLVSEMIRRDRVVT